MNESLTRTTKHFSPTASLAAMGVKVGQLHLFGPIRTQVQIRQKTIKQTPADTRYDAFISLLARAHGLVELNTGLRSDPALQQAFGSSACAEQSVVQETLDACSADTVRHLQQALAEISREHRQSVQHDYQAGFQLLDGDMSGLPCGPKAAFAPKGSFAGQDPRRGRPVGRRLSTQSEEVVVDRLFAGNVQLIKALQPVVEAAAATWPLDEAKRAPTILRVDAGSGTLADLNWLLARGYEIMAKEYSGPRVLPLARTVTQWVQDPDWSEGSFGWVTEPPTGSVRPLRRLAVRCRRQDGPFAYGVLICSLSAEQVRAVLGRSRAQAADPTAVLTAYVTFYDQRGGGSETSFTGDKQGLGLTTHHKKRCEAHHMLVLLGSLAHSVVVWARQWLSCHTIHRYGLRRMGRDVFPISGWLRFDASGSVGEIVLNQQACLAHSFICPVQTLLAPLGVVVNLGET